MSYRYQVQDAATLTDHEIAQTVALWNVIQAEMLPDDAPTSVEDTITSLRMMPARVRRYAVRGHDDQGNLVASTGTGFDPEHDDNPDVMWSGVRVHPDHRRRGVGADVLAHLVAIARVEGRTRIVGETAERIPTGSEFAKAAGAEAKIELHLNHLPTSNVDRALMERWAKEAPDRAPDYELLAWDGPVPDEHLAAFLDLILVMNDAPREDLEVNDFTHSAEEQREGEERFAAIGGVHWTLVARRVSDGAFAGFHDVSWVPANPKVVWVGATGVRPEHRGFALGKWLKAAMTLRILDEMPEVADIRTGNAQSNDAMLGINHAMGYECLFSQTTWELSIDAAEQWLAARGTKIPEIDVTF